MDSHKEPIKTDYPPEAAPQTGGVVAGDGVTDIEGLAHTAEQHLGIDSDAEMDPTQTLSSRVKTVLIGKPRNLSDHSIYHTLSLVAFLAWVGLGADGLSSSAYGPAEAFTTLTVPSMATIVLALFLALATAVTVLVISACYSHIIEEFPTGGGGYLVASKLLGPAWA